MIDVENLSKLYGSFTAVDSVSFGIAKGEIVGLLGPNGAGKTTTMRMVTGFLEPSQGSIRIDGQELSADPLTAKRKIGYLPENAPLYSDMIVADYLDYVARVQGVDGSARIPELARVCGLVEVMHKNVSELSRGYRQRVGLAHALIHDPEILILDEPTSGLDPNQIIDVRALIKEIGKTKTVIISTHILSEVEMLCDRVIIISRGRIAADSPTSELRRRFGHHSQLRIQLSGATADEARTLFKGLAGAGEVASVDGEKGLVALEISVDAGSDLRPEVFKAASAKGWILMEMTLRQNSLEDVFRNLTTTGDSV